VPGVEEPNCEDRRQLPLVYAPLAVAGLLLPRDRASPLYVGSGLIIAVAADPLKLKAGRKGIGNGRKTLPGFHGPPLRPMYRTVIAENGRPNNSMGKPLVRPVGSKRFDRYGSKILSKWLDDPPGEDVMSELYQSLSHSKWDCVPRCVRAQATTEGHLRPNASATGAIFHSLARQKACQIIESHRMPDHVHMRISISTQAPGASVIGFLTGKSAIAIARLCGKERNVTGEHFWARG
jgi:putative transposase